MPEDVTEPHEVVDARDPEAHHILFQGAVEGHVLVKNNNKTLPLRQPKLLSLFGYSAKSPDSFSPLEGNVESFSWEFGGQSLSAHEIWSGFNHEACNFSTIAPNGTLIHGGGSSATTPFSFLSPFDALRLRAWKDGTAIIHDFESPQPAVHPGSDACIVFANAWASEGYDRPGLRDDYTDGLIRHVADGCESTIAVFHNAGVRLVDTFQDHPNVKAIIFAHLPGEETGNALAALLHGDENFSGKLPYTVPRNETDYGDLLHPAGPGGPADKYQHYPQSNFSEGMHMNYRHFDTKEYQPRYDFGFGMSYTTFELSNPRVVLPLEGLSNVGEWPLEEIVQGGREDLWDVIAHVKVTLKNKGEVAGAEVAQLYLSIPDRHPKQLRGFSKHYLEPGESVEVTFQLTRRDASLWSVENQEWQLSQHGTFKADLGTSRGGTNLEVSFGIPEAQSPAGLVGVLDLLGAK